MIFLILGAIALLGWKEAGSHLPAFDSLMPKGKLKLPLLVSSLNLVLFAVGCTFFTEASSRCEGLPRREVVHFPRPLARGPTGMRPACWPPSPALPG